MFHTIIYKFFSYVKENYFYILLLLISFLQYRKTGNILFGGKSKMVYKTETDLYKSVKLGQDFTGCHLVKTWRVNAQGNLEETGELVDIDELIESNRDTCLANVLAKFTEVEQGLTKIDNENVSRYSGMQDDLIELGELMERGEELRDKYKLDDKLTTKQVFDYVTKQSQELNAKIKLEQEKMKAVKAVIENGGIKNEEKKNEQESK